jgi:hypothetical protein
MTLVFMNEDSPRGGELKHSTKRNQPSLAPDYTLKAGEH